MALSLFVISVFGSCFWLLGSLPAAAQGPLDVDRYIEIVMRSHPAVLEARAFQEAAEAERKAGRLLPDLTLELSRGSGRATEGPRIEAGEVSLSATQIIPWPATFAAGVRAADRAAEALTASGEAVRWEIEIGARHAFARLLAARALFEVARLAEEDARSLRDLVARRAELGETRESDRIKASVEWLRQQRNLRSAEREAEAAEIIVRTLALEPLPRPLTIRGDLPRPFPSLDREKLKARLVERNPRLQAALSEAARSEALLSFARRGRVPDLGVSVFHEREVDREANGFALALRLPLWNANRGEIARARAASRLAAAAAERTRIDLTTELEARLKELEVAASQVALLEEEILPAATRSLSLARFTYEEGETSLLDLLDAQRTHRDTEREAVDTRLAMALALTELQRLVGPDFDPWN